MKMTCLLAVPPLLRFVPVYFTVQKIVFLNKSVYYSTTDNPPDKACEYQSKSWTLTDQMVTYSYLTTTLTLNIW